MFYIDFYQTMTLLNSIQTILFKANIVEEANTDESLWETGYWIGFNDRDKEDSFVWTDETYSMVCMPYNVKTWYLQKIL